MLYFCLLNILQLFFCPENLYYVFDIALKTKPVPGFTYIVVVASDVLASSSGNPRSYDDTTTWESN
jgi:hypothetical protein